MLFFIDLSRRRLPSSKIEELGISSTLSALSVRAVQHAKSQGYTSGWAVEVRLWPDG